MSSRTLSLRHALALAMTGLAAVAVILAVLLAHAEVRRSSRIAVEERISRVADQLARLAASSAEQRRGLLVEVGRSPVLAAALRGEAVDDLELGEALAVLRNPADAGLPVQLWDLHGGPIYSDIPATPPREHGLMHAIPLTSEPAYGSFHEVRGEARYFSTAPVWDGETQVGWIVQQRRIGNPQTAAEIQRLIGAESRVLFAYETDSVWISLAGEPVRAPLVAAPADSVMVFAGAGGERFLVHGRRVAGTPWSVMVEVPATMAEAGASAFVRRMAVAGLLLVLAAMALAWLLSRRLTRPLRGLAAASDALAAGDLSRRVPESGGGDEVERVAAAFNAMAERVAASHAELEARLADARALASELERARVAAESADRAKSEFLATMSHEIRTPINAVLGLCEIMSLDGVGPERRQDYLRRTQRAARQLASLVDDVLDLTKAESGGIRIEAVSRAAAASVESVVELLADELRRKELRLEVDVPAALTYHADPQRVEQILLNLVANAVKFTPAGGAIRIVGEAAVGDRVHLRVEDTGIGVDAGEIERIFEPFVQAQTGYTREYGGSGLGLSISRRLARLMGGDILAASEPGGGSRFTLVVPAGTPSAQPA